MTPRSSRLDEWKPLETSGSEQVGNKKKVIWKHPLQKVCNYSLYLPNDFAIDHPCYWRRNKNDPANIELSTFRVDQRNDVSEVRIRIPIWITNDKHLASLQANAGPDREGLLIIGWSLSYAWKTDDLVWFAKPEVDIERAKPFFAAAAEQGSWLGWTLLGVIARDGLGAEPDPKRAFELFQKAALSGEPRALRNLSKCYRDGYGVDKDIGRANFLEQLVTLREGGCSIDYLCLMI
jgi:hypothetical protein